MDEPVPREGWADFCERFTRQHHGWLVTLEHRPAPAGAVTRRKSAPAALSEFRSLQLAGRATDQKLSITTADQAGHEQITSVRRPVDLIFEKTPDGSHSGLRLDGRDGERLILRFRIPARPEALDGLASIDERSAAE